MPTPTPGEFPLWAVPLFPAFFAAVWLGVCALLAYAGGWPRLAAHFKASGRPGGTPIKGQVKGIGFVGENKVTHLIASPAGLYLYATPLFRFNRPPLLLPWARVRFLRERKFMRVSRYEFDLAGITTITLTRQGYDALSSFAQRGGPEDAPRP